MGGADECVVLSGFGACFVILLMVYTLVGRFVGDVLLACAGGFGRS